MSIHRTNDEELPPFLYNKAIKLPEQSVKWNKRVRMPLPAGHIYGIINAIQLKYIDDTFTCQVAYVMIGL